MSVFFASIVIVFSFEVLSQYKVVVPAQTADVSDYQNYLARFEGEWESYADWFIKAHFVPDLAVIRDFERLQDFYFRKDERLESSLMDFLAQRHQKPWGPSMRRLFGAALLMAMRLNGGEKWTTEWSLWSALDGELASLRKRFPDAWKLAEKQSSQRWLSIFRPSQKGLRVFLNGVEFIKPILKLPAESLVHVTWIPQGEHVQMRVTRVSEIWDWSLFSQKRLLVSGSCLEPKLDELPGSLRYRARLYYSDYCIWDLNAQGKLIRSTNQQTAHDTHHWWWYLAAALATSWVGYEYFGEKSFQ